MERLYWLIVILTGVMLSGCAIMSSSDPKPSATSTPTTSTPTNPAPAPAKKAAADTKEKPATKSTICPKKKKTNTPLAVQVYPKGTAITHPYTVLARETVSKFNAHGIKRQLATIHDTFRRLAVTLGGDAVINVTRGPNEVTGTIISFKNGDIG